MPAMQIATESTMTPTTLSDEELEWKRQGFRIEKDIDFSKVNLHELWQAFLLLVLLLTCFYLVSCCCTGKHGFLAVMNRATVHQIFTWYFFIWNFVKIENPIKLKKTSKPKTRPEPAKLKKKGPKPDKGPKRLRRLNKRCFAISWKWLKLK